MLAAETLPYCVLNCAALSPIMEEASGTFTDWDGTPTTQRPDVIATPHTAGLTPEAIAKLR